jgi:proteasome lid subunit RPN8/RPN11
MRMAKAHWEELVVHARAEAPNECCGYLKAKDGLVEQVFRATNERASPYGYELDPRSLLAANELDDDGFEVGIYHSHPRSPAEPSQTDINLAHYPHWTYLIVSLANDEPEVRAWRIDDGRVDEEDLVVE